ncbi:MAG TPA: ABC transporter permease [Pseudogracilibacillus sp.]|nr:ABC transporter permease [Pseudogracilibacillus sp.]
MGLILKMRFIFWRKQWVSLLFWLCFPLVVTWFVMVQFATLQADTKIPVGIVMEDESSSAQELYNSIKDTPHIRPEVLSEKEALNQLQKHELDSVFIIRSRYEDSIERGSRNQLIKSYQSDLSFAYTPLRETVISYVQQDYSRAKAAFVVQQMGEVYGVTEEWSYDELINRSKEIVQEQKLLEVDFSFADAGAGKDDADDTLLQPWNLWAIITLLATFMLFDWVIKEKKASATLRFVYGKVSFKRYLLQNMLIYLFVLFVMDVVTMGVFHFLFDENISMKLFISLIGYRVMLTTCAFLFSLCFTSTYVYYTSSFAIVLFTALLSGVFIPVDGIMEKWNGFSFINPLAIFLESSFVNLWLWIGIVFTALWFIRKGEADA